MLSLKFLGDLIFIYLPYSFFIYAFLFMMWNRCPHLFSIKLKRVNSEKYIIAKEINKRPEIITTIGDVNFLVNFGFLFFPFRRIDRRTFAYVLWVFYPQTVFLNPLRFNIEYFDVLVAHEIGHLCKKHVGNELKQELEADGFASVICGEERVEDANKQYGWKHGDCIT